MGTPASPLILPPTVPKCKFVDVCNVLTIANYRDALSDFDDDQKGVVTIDTPGGKQQLLTVTGSLGARSNHNKSSKALPHPKLYFVEIFLHLRLVSNIEQFRSVMEYS